MPDKEFEAFEESFAQLSVATAFHYFKKMNDMLSQDTVRCMDECRNAKKAVEGTRPYFSEEDKELSFWYRNLARSFMTYVDGILFVMRRLVSFAYDRGEIELTPGEIALVREEVYLMKNKKIVPREKFNRVMENFVLAFRFFPSVLGSSYEVDYSNHGWRSFQALVRMRNAVTHPKAVQDTLLAPSMPNTIRDAAAWFFTCMQALVSSLDYGLIDESMKRTVEMPEMKEMLRRQKEKKGGKS